MITIISDNNNDNVHYIERCIAQRGIDRATVIANASNMHTYLNTAVVTSNIIVCIGDSFAIKQSICRTIDLPIVYDKVTNNHIVNYCHKTSRPLPAQHMLDNLCCMPEGFVSMANYNSEQCACCGQFKKTTIFILPDNYGDVSYIYSNYVVKIVDKLYPILGGHIYKTFGLTTEDIRIKLNGTLNARVVSHYCETTADLIGTVVIRPLAKITAQQMKNIDSSVIACLGMNLYATTDKSLAQELVDLLSSLHKTVAVAESITGGLLASSIVDIAGASRILQEAVVTYTIASKHRRLGINPHMIDAVGVVSAEVATAMVDNVKAQSGADFAISTTGYAGPIPADGMPIGMCYVGIATQNGSNSYKLQFNGDRQNIRKQAVNSALLLLINSIKNVTI